MKYLVISLAEAPLNVVERLLIAYLKSCSAASLQDMKRDLGSIISEEELDDALASLVRKGYAVEDEDQIVLTRTALKLYHEESDEGLPLNDWSWGDLVAWLADRLNKATFSLKEMQVLANWRKAGLEPRVIAEAFDKAYRRKLAYLKDIPRNLCYWAKVIEEDLQIKQRCAMCGRIVDALVQTGNGPVCFVCAKAIGEVK